MARKDPRNATRKPRSPAYGVKREEAARLISSGHTVAEASERLGVSTTTLGRWLGEPKMMAMLSELRQDAIDEAKGRLKDAAAVAVEALVDAARDGDTKAAVAILDRVGINGKATIEHTGSVDLSTMPREQLLEELEEARKLMGGGDE